MRLEFYTRAHMEENPLGKQVSTSSKKIAVLLVMLAVVQMKVLLDINKN